MMTLRKLANVSLIAVVTLAAAGACSNDDDDDDTPSGGRAGAGSGGRAGATSGGASAAAGQGTSNEGGANEGGANDSASGGAFNEGGHAGMGGASAGGLPGGSGGEATGEGGAASATSSLSDAQILLVLDTLNRGEVEEAYAALPRLTDADVEAFARTMIDEHGAARQSVVATAESLAVAPQPSAVQRALAQESEAHVAALHSSSAAELDASYMAMQVAMHAEALALLDELEDAADAAALRALIGELSNAVEAHYDMAVDIEAGI